MAIAQVLKLQARVEVRLFNMVTDTIREIAAYAVIASYREELACYIN